MPAADAPDPTRGAGHPQRWRRLASSLVAIAAIVLLVVALRAWTSSEQIQVTVAAGTAQRIAQGETVELLPRTLEVEVGDALEIVNEDAVTHDVGPYTVAPGQTLTQTFTAPGTLEGACTLHPSGSITIIVR